MLFSLKSHRILDAKVTPASFFLPKIISDDNTYKTNILKLLI